MRHVFGRNAILFNWLYFFIFEFHVSYFLFSDLLLSYSSPLGDRARIARSPDLEVVASLKGPVYSI